MKILIIEDDIKTLKILCRVIEQKGYETDLADSGSTALEMIETHAYDLVILDLDISNGDTLAICKRSGQLIQVFPSCSCPAGTTHSS